MLGHGRRRQSFLGFRDARLRVSATSTKFPTDRHFIEEQMFRRLPGAYDDELSPRRKPRDDA